MPRVDLGSEALHLLRERLGVGVGRSVEQAVHWSFWGTQQRAWCEPIAGDGNWPTWRLHLRTRLLDGFSGSPAQTSALAATMLHTSLAGVVWSPDPPDQLELASAVDLHEGSCDWVVRLAAAAARAQAAEARHLLSSSKALASAGLTPAIDTTAAFPAGVLNAGEVLLRDTQPHGAGSGWFAQEIATCADAVRLLGQAQVVKTPWGMSATFAQSGAVQARSILEVRRDAGRPLLGRGLSITLWTPLRGGPLEALQWNEREVGPSNPNCALGGWWAPEGGFLVHSSFFPEVFCQADHVWQWLRTYTRRANDVNGIVAGRPATS